MTSLSNVQNTLQLVNLPMNSNNANHFPCPTTTTPIPRNSVVQTWEHHINDIDLTKGFSIKILQSMTNNQNIKVEGYNNEEFKCEMRFVGTKKYMHEINRCKCVRPFTACNHFEENFDDHIVREFVEVFITDSATKITIEERKLYKEYKVQRTKKMIPISIVEETGKFIRNIDRIELCELTVTVYPQKYRRFSYEQVTEKSCQTLSVRHDGFEDHWNERYSYQKVSLYDHHQWIDQKLSNVKINHVNRIVYEHDDNKHTSKVMDVFYYQGKNNPALYDNNNVPRDCYDNPSAFTTKFVDHQVERVILNKGSWNPWSIYRFTYKRPDGSTYVTEGY